MCREWQQFAQYVRYSKKETYIVINLVNVSRRKKTKNNHLVF